MTKKAQKKKKDRWIPQRTDAWKAEEVKRLATESGRPLEVECATAFAKNDSEWRIDLGPYYFDTQSGKSRELDVLVSRTHTYEDTGGHNQTIAMQIFISCKGFNAEQIPLSNPR